MGSGAAIVVGLIVLLAVAGYLGLVLPRLGAWIGLGASAAFAVGLLLLALAFTPWTATAPMLGVVALAFGHAGWWMGRRATAVRRAAHRLHSQWPAGKDARRREAAGRGKGRRGSASPRPARPLLADDRPPPAAAAEAAGATGPTRDAAAPAASRPATAPLSAGPASAAAAAAGPAARFPAGAATPAPFVPGAPGAPASPPTRPVTGPPPPLLDDPAAWPPEPPPALRTAPVHVQALALADLQRTSLGRYRIDRAIGRGSMGAVYQGLDTAMGRPVALKTLSLGQEFEGAELHEAKARFFREAETAGRLQHRDIVTIHDVGEEGDVAYIAMELLRGHDLTRHTQPGQLLPVPVVLRIGARVADALAYAHRQGVVHRDIKPANVMLHLPTGAVKVMDFGIARVTDASRTRTGMVLGTPSFMSPEHLAGQRVDGRTDLYSLGVMLYQLLTGRLPFQADSMAKLMYQIAHDPPRDLRVARPELPEPLAQLIGRVLAKLPAQRPADGQQLAAELRAIDAAGEGPLWAPPAPPGGAEGGPGVPPAPGAASPTAYDATVRLPPGQSGHNPAS